MKYLKIKTCRGIVKGKTIVLEEDTGLPEGIKAQVLIMPIKPNLEKIIKEQLKLLNKAPAVGRLLYKNREELYER